MVVLWQVADNLGMLGIHVYLFDVLQVPAPGERLLRCLQVGSLATCFEAALAGPARFAQTASAQTGDLARC